MEKLVNWESEICCDECGEIVHNHFDCPGCGRKHAPTSMYSAPEIGDMFTCEDCGAQFIFVNYAEDCRAFIRSK